jgi:exonuclease VII small subunit
LDPGEPGEHGVWLVEFESVGGPRFEFLPTSSVRYERLPIDVSGLNYAEAEDAIGAILAEYAQSATLAVVRIDLIGRSSLKVEDINRLQSRAQEYAAQGVTVEWVRGGQLRPPIDLEAIAASQDGIARLAQAILSLQRGTELDSRLGLRLAKVQEKLVDLKFKDEAIVDRTINSAYRVLEALL